MVGMQYETKALNVFGAAGGITEETIGNIRTVQSLNQEHEFIEEYEEKIKQNEHFNGIKEQCLGLGFSVIIFFMIASHSIGDECPNECNGNIQFDYVQFVYPTRPSHHVLKGIDIEIKKGETIALVGASGCRKSTTIQLVQRNYESNGVRVTLDGKDIRELNIKWLRNQIGLVGQEPVLFAGTIREILCLELKKEQHQVKKR
ncbi:hypothetical protein ENUP19_0157G0009 [Entamoeba nuttalli]|uniref:ABC transmembrane type-1 domain-containing protein n=1 Tax=Entamoeba nuttalli TaxID=412467 RepID=A0ABQ0DLB0_9EUKA